MQASDTPNRQFFEVNKVKWATLGVLVAAVLISWTFFLVATCFIWLPILIMASPLLLITFLLVKYTPVGNPVREAYYRLYDFLVYNSEKPRLFIWGFFYDAICFLYPQSKWKVMNYGYAVLNENGHLVALKEEDQEERFCLQLYHYVATSLNTVKNLAGKTVVEVGCGRGGGLNYVKRYLSPERCIGFDLSENQVKFCQTYYSEDNLEYHQGSAGDFAGLAPVKDGVDVVLNVESSHCYPSFSEFVSQVDKVLKPGGIFAFTDFRAADKIEEMEKELEAHSLRIVKKEDITINVLHGLKLDEERRMKLIDGYVHKGLRTLFKKFSGLNGTRINQEMIDKQTIYMAYTLQKE